MFDYVVFVGDEVENLDPMLAVPSAEEGKQMIEEHFNKFKYAEVVYMPADDMDINECVYVTPALAEEYNKRGIYYGKDSN